MKYNNDLVTNSISVFTGLTGIAITQVYEIIGIIVLILSALNILINMAFKIKDAIKQKQYEKVTTIIDDAKNQLDDLDNNKKE